ncbi:putative acyl-CoA dehydrogenase [Scytonema sp. HK-05]|uniref:acyl-CoA dehydrogenase family protein n=1 Tax=Scytonema sp. HK-05 TaxID=1137095 RepID=UPI000936440D|nr:acyl-CoA dehydrogenase family protein [Scytonema sp. HK-05]OKH56762.1 acyl-CoA dehydrogenase [Scytonema sp. HK-05]BAY44936.1 putative acyl-CoA dehydrogenase [Scytonema sp. HK-05]
MRSPYFTTEHNTFRERVRRFISQEVLPFADDWEYNRCIPKEIWQKMGQMGFLGINYPKAYGGSEMDFFFSVVFLEEIGRAGYGGFRAAVSVHEYMATYYIAHAGSDELKRKYLSPAIAGEKLGALGITERNAGSDINQIQTSAVHDGDNYIVNGAKTFITSGTTADFVTLAVRTTPSKAMSKRGATGISLLVVDTDSEGLSTKKLDNKIGWHCSDTAELYFKNVRVPAENLVGRFNCGFYYIMQCFQLERLTAGIVALGEIDHCLEVTRRYIAQRKAFSSPLTNFQALRHRIADLVTDVEAARQLIYHTAWLYQQGELPIAECSMAKLKVTELANRVVNECLQFHGGYGYLEEYPIARMYRDIRVGTIAGGTSEIMREIIAQITIDEVRHDSRT